MILLTNSEGWPGLTDTIRRLRAGEHGLDAMVSGIGQVEREPSVRSVGFGGWPDMLGNMSFDAGVMDGTTREAASVGAVEGVLSVARLAREVMRRLPHVALTGAGAARFAREIGFDTEETLHADSRRAWRERLERELSPADLAGFPDIPLVPLSRAITDPERVRDTTVFLCRDAQSGLHAATSTSGWAWKYPGRLGDSPIPGAGFYADTRFGACACTHTGEMTMRAGTARTVVLALRLGHTLDEALNLAVAELAELTAGFLGGVVLHALDARGDHKVVSFRCGADIRYWFWQDGMDEAEERVAEVA